MRFSLYRTLSFRYLYQRRFRAALVVASIALGVAMLVATRVLNVSMQAAAHQSSEPLPGAADLHVGNGDSGIARDLGHELAAVPGVQSVVPILVERIQLPDLKNRSGTLVGVELTPDRWKDNAYGITANIDSASSLRAQFLGQPLLLVGKGLADELATKVPAYATTFNVTALGKPKTLPRWVGTVEATGPAATLGGNVLFMEVGAAATFLGHPDRISRFDVTMAPNVDRKSVVAALRAVVGERAIVETPEDGEKAVDKMLSGLQIGFTMCGAGALVVGLFLVYNVLSVSVNERRHEIGILRSLGATRNQVVYLFVVEAALLGVLGGGLGLPLGLALAHVGLGPMQSVFRDLFVDLEAREVLVRTDILVTAMLAGVITAAVAALIPAMRAANEPPAGAVRRIPPPPGLGPFRLALAAGIASFLIAGAFASGRRYLPEGMGTYGCLDAGLVGLLVLTPLASVMIARLLQPLAHRWLNLDGRLAVDNLVRSPGRTGLVVTALAAGVAMVLLIAGVIRSNEDVILHWIEQTIMADLFVTSGSPVSGSGQNLPLRDELGRQIEAEMPEVAAAVPVRFQKILFRHDKVFVLAVDSNKLCAAAQGRGDPSDLAAFGRMTDSAVPDVVISDNFSALYGIHVGDTFELRGPKGPVEVRAAAQIVDYSWNRGTVFIDLATFRSHFDAEAVNDVFDLFLKPGADPEVVRKRLAERWGGEHDLVVLTRGELRGRVQTIIHDLYRIAYSQGIVVAIVAALGVVTAVLISVMQRRSELGVLRAVGATRAQVLRSVLAEAAFMGLIGTVLGLLIGVPVEWYILQFVLFEETGFGFAVSIPWTEAGVISAASLTLATLAGLGPALQTLRLRIPEAIAYE